MGGSGRVKELVGIIAILFGANWSTVLYVWRDCHTICSYDNILCILRDRERAWNLDLAIASFILNCLLHALPEAWSGACHGGVGVLEAFARRARRANRTRIRCSVARASPSSTWERLLLIEEAGFLKPAVSGCHVLFNGVKGMRGIWRGEKKGKEKNIQ